VIEHALAAGDECHGRTAAANERLLAVLDGLSAGDAALIAANPNFVLPVLMAAACGLLGRQPSGVAAVGGNGEAFGFRLHGAAAWTVVPAQPPVGGRLPGREHAAALGAIGDSAVLDFCGLGGQAMHLAPSLSSEWASLLVDDPVARRSAVIDPQSGLVDVARVVAGGPVPQVNLAILDRTGRSGLLGRGFYLPPSALFDRTG
jgi:hypothetical protein